MKKSFYDFIIRKIQLVFTRTIFTKDTCWLEHERRSNDHVQLQTKPCLTLRISSVGRSMAVLLYAWCISMLWCWQIQPFCTSYIDAIYLFILNERPSKHFSAVYFVYAKLAEKYTFFFSSETIKTHDLLF